MAEIARKLGGCTSATAKVVLKKEGRIKGVNFPLRPPIHVPQANGNGAWGGCVFDLCVEAFGGLSIDNPVTGPW
jgi:hypothetical protein